MSLQKVSQKYAIDRDKIECLSVMENPADSDKPEPVWALAIQFDSGDKIFISCRVEAQEIIDSLGMAQEFPQFRPKE